MGLYRDKKREAFFIADRDILDKYIADHYMEEGSLKWQDLELVSNEDAVLDFVKKYNVAKILKLDVK